MYQQKMCYIDLYKNGLKCGNMGHVRLEWNEEQYRFSVNLCRLDRHTLVSAVIKRKEKEQEDKLHDIPIIHGRGSYQSDWIPVWGDENQLRFEASGGIYGVCSLPVMGDARTESVDELPERLPDDQSAEPETHETEESVPVQTCAAEDPAPVQTYEAEEPVPAQTHAAETERNMLEEIRRERETLSATKLLDNKWEQLCSMYEKVRPIGDDIEFVKIRPEDFVILRQEYQGLVRNSFLLHGYYNYHYILLGKYPDKYYIGVPGIMHEQERMAAAMFGFIGFERASKKSVCGEKGAEQNNDNFGYYMMEVAI